MLFGKWQDVIPELEEKGIDFDGIFFDTFGEHYRDLKEFNDHLPNILRSDGIYSFFNGLGGTNVFFHDVYCNIVQMDLQEIGLETKMTEIIVDELGDDTWKDLKRPYWSLQKYQIPTCHFPL